MTVTANKVSPTPGPWRVEQRGETHHVISPVNCAHAIGKGTVVADVIDRDECFSAEADARLIAAAPDLLAALRAMHALFSTRSYRPDSPTSIAVLMAHNAIRKATGGAE